MNPNFSSSILKEGLIVSTRLGSSAAWYKNIIYKCEEDKAYICLLESYLENIIAKDLKITLKLTNEFFEYLFEGSISDICPEYPSHVLMTIHKVEELVNTRAFPRYDIYLPASIKPLWEDTKNFSIVTNICLGGIAFLSKHEFDYGEESEVSVYLPGNQTISGRGKVIRKSVKNGQFSYSMQFVDMTEENSIILSNYLAELDEDIAALQVNFFENIRGLI
ncbi:MAG: PilZ domain-containing protein [Clostridia bacterium]|nr:PilZ domain-containing protein [Clostridia bacterium]